MKSRPGAPAESQHARAAALSKGKQVAAQPARNRLPRLLCRPLLLAMVGIVLTLHASWNGLWVWSNLPLAQPYRISASSRWVVYARVTRDTKQPASCGERYAHRPYQTREGALEFSAFGRFRSAWADPGELPALRAATDALALEPTLSLLPRLGQAATTVLELQQRGVAADAWWPALEPYLRGLEVANLSHFQGARRSALADAGVQVGMAPGSAWQDADRLIESQLGMFLQSLSPALERAAAAAETTGNAAGARTCRRVLRNLLKSWVLETGPAGLRLVAADLLAAHLAPEDGGAGAVPASAPAATDAALGTDLQNLVKLYRERRSSAPRGLLDSAGQPVLDREAYTALAGALSAASVLGGAAITSGVVALCCILAGFRALRAAPITPGHRISHILVWGAALALALIVHADGLAWQNDWLRTAENTERGPGAAVIFGWPRLPLYGAAIPIVGYAVLMLAPARERETGTRARAGRIVRVGRTALAAWLVTVVLADGALWRADGARRRYEQSVAGAYSRGEIETVLADDYDRLITGLRAWNP